MSVRSVNSSHPESCEGRVIRLDRYLARKLMGWSTDVQEGESTAGDLLKIETQRVQMLSALGQFVSFEDEEDEVERKLA